MHWTDEQQAIFDAGLNSPTSLMIQAYAGCGKTTTLEELTKRMKKTSALALSFGVKTTSELKARLPDWIEVRTANSLGHRAWCSAIGKNCEVDKDKLFKLLNASGAREDDWHTLRALLISARQNGLVPTGSTGISLIPDTFDGWSSLTDFDVSEELTDLARKTLKKSISLGYQGVIDYDDQIYLSSLFGGVFPRYKLVLLDEQQDLSTLNIRQIKRSADDRIIGFGDRNQSIFAFRGADANSIDTIRTLRDDWIDLTLSETHRCCRSVVRRRNKFLPEFRAADGCVEGSVTELHDSWKWSEIPRAGTIAILSRNNAPLYGMSIKLLNIGVSAFILGRESARTLINLAKKIVPRSGDTSELTEAVELWRDDQVKTATEDKKFSRIALIHDKADGLITVINNVSATSRDEVIQALRDILSQSVGSVTLATAHKAKGLEFDTVIHLDPWRIPSKYAETMDEIQQEMNILNVIETRTKVHFVTADLQNFRGR